MIGVQEATTHGTLAWNAPYQRRSVLFRYSPANLSYAGPHPPPSPKPHRRQTPLIRHGSSLATSLDTPIADSTAQV